MQDNLDPEVVKLVLRRLAELQSNLFIDSEDRSCILKAMGYLITIIERGEREAEFNNGYEG